MPQSVSVGRLRPDQPPCPTSSCRRCQRPAPSLDSPAALYWELIAKDGEVVDALVAAVLAVLVGFQAVRFREARARIRTAP